MKMNIDKLSLILAIILTIILGSFSKISGVSPYLIRDVLMYLFIVALIISVVVFIKGMRNNKKRNKERTPRQTQIAAVIPFGIAAIISTLTGISIYWFFIPIIIVSILVDLFEKKRGQKNDL